jgi:hypothetical protein
MNIENRYNLSLLKDQRVKQAKNSIIIAVRKNSVAIFSGHRMYSHLVIFNWKVISFMSPSCCILGLKKSTFKPALML